MTISPDTVLAKIEGLQAWAYRHVGRDPAKIPGELNTMRSRKPPDIANSHAAPDTLEIETDVRKLAHMDEVHRLWRTTKYQDPIILSAIGVPFERVLAAAKAVEPPPMPLLKNPKAYEKRTYLHTRPLLSTVPVGLLNGFAIRDHRGEYGIVLQEGLRFIPAILSHTIGKALFAKAGHRYAICFDTSKADANEIAESENDLMTVFLIDTISDANPAPSNESYERIARDGELQDMHVALEFGFKFFLLAHEYAHCISGHFDQIEQVPGAQYFVRSREEISAALKTLREEYGHLPEPDEAQMLAFTHLHTLEFDADKTAIRILMRYLLTDDPNLESGRSLLVLLGAFMFFWYVELTERVHRIFELGKSWFDDPLYGEHYLVNDLLFRPTHPAPLERLIWATKIAFECVGHDKGMEQAIMNPLIWIGNYFDSAWKHGRSLAAEGVQESNYQINRKWITFLPDVGAAIGLPRSSNSFSGSP
jgi:hypothetical protein